MSRWRKNKDKRLPPGKSPDLEATPVNAPVVETHKAKPRSKPAYKAVGFLLLCLIALTWGALAFFARSENSDSAIANRRRLAVSRQERRFMREQEETDEPPEMANGGAASSGEGVKTVEESLKAEHAPAAPHGKGGKGSR